MMAPLFIAAKWRLSSTLMSPVAVMKMSPIGAASLIGMTRKPSMTASSAFIGSISVTITSAPRPFARMAMPRLHQP